MAQEKRDERSIELNQDYRHSHSKVIKRPDGNGTKHVFHGFYCCCFYYSQRRIAALPLTLNPPTNIKPRSGAQKNKLSSWTWQADGASDHLFPSFLPCADTFQQMEVCEKENIPSGVFLKLLKWCSDGGSSIKTTSHFPSFLSQDKHNKCYLCAEKVFIFLFFYQKSLVAPW